MDGTGHDYASDELLSSTVLRLFNELVLQVFYKYHVYLELFLAFNYWYMLHWNSSRSYSIVLYIIVS